MIKKLIAPMLLATLYMLLPATNARAQEVCEGTWQTLAPGADWAGPSTCACFRNGQSFGGGAYVSSGWFGWVWSTGAGPIKVLLELTRTSMRGNVTINETRVEYAVRANGEPYVAEPGLGTDAAMTVPRAQGWTVQRFRADCALSRW